MQNDISRCPRLVTRFPRCHCFTQPWQWDSLKCCTKYFVAPKSTFSYESSYGFSWWTPDLWNFVRGFRQFSSHLTKYHTCLAICTLSPLDAALALPFTKNTQDDTSKVLRLPREITMVIAKVCACHEKCNSSFSNLPKHYKPVAQTPFDTLWNMSECHSVLCLPRETALRDVWSFTHFRTAAQCLANTPSTPKPPDWNGNPCYAFGKNVGCDQQFSKACGTKQAGCNQKRSVNPVWSTRIRLSAIRIVT